MNKINRIVTDIEIVNTKIITLVNLANLPDPLDLIIDCGATMTTITPQLFKRLKLNIKEKANVNILGINSTEQSFSILIPSFTIGGVNLGEVSKDCNWYNATRISEQNNIRYEYIRLV